MLLASFALFGAIFLVSLYLQDIQGYSAVQAGVRMLPLTLTTLFVAPLAGKLAKRGPTGLLLGGSVLTGLATASLTQLGIHSGYGWLGSPDFAVLGVGLALALPTVVALVVDRVTADRVGVASGLVRDPRAKSAVRSAWPCWPPAASRVAGDTFLHRTGLAPLRGLVAGGQIDDVARLAGSTVAGSAVQSFLESGFARPCGSPPRPSAGPAHRPGPDPRCHPSTTPPADPPSLNHQEACHDHHTHPSDDRHRGDRDRADPPLRHRKRNRPRAARSVPHGARPANWSP